MGRVAVKRKTMPFAPCARDQSSGFWRDSAIMRLWYTTRRNFFENHNPDSIA
jgi:hypothetical protein